MNSKSKYIYVVDDNSLSLKILQKVIRSTLGYEYHVRTFTKAEDCINTTGKRLPDLIIADYNLDPENEGFMNGDGLLLEIKKLHPNVPVIMYSSVDSTQLVVKLIKHGAEDFVPRKKNFIPHIIKSLSEEIEIQGINKRSENYLIKGVLVFLLLLAGHFLIEHYQPSWLSFYTPIFIILLLSMIFWIFYKKDRIKKYKSKNM